MRMKTTYLIVFVMIVIGVNLRADAPAANADDAMVDALVQEGLLTHAQAERVRAKINQAEEESPSSKIALSDAVKKLTFYGDGRLRFENIDQHNTMRPRSSTTASAIGCAWAPITPTPII